MFIDNEIEIVLPSKLGGRGIQFRVKGLPTIVICLLAAAAAVWGRAVFGL